MDLIPSSVAGVLVIVLALLPGVPGDRLYRIVAGVSWREKQFDFVLRLLLFGTLGLAGYALVADAVGLPPPAYVIPSTFGANGLSASELSGLGIAYLGHMAIATVLGGATAYGMRLTVRYATISGDRDAWDHFVEFCLPSHWAVVTLRSGESFLAMIDHADICAGPAHRDLIIIEPAEYNPTTGSYENSTKQMMFLRGDDIASIATIYDENIDTRVIAPGELVLEGDT